ncbi:MAG: IS4 family transposase [Candidatus Binatia bacterium]
MNWRAANGQLREMSCRLALLELERRGELVLPARRSCVRTRLAAQHWEGIEDRQLRCTIEELGEIKLVGVSATEDGDLSGLWNDLIAGYHYLGYTPLAGAQKRYLIASEHRGYLGALGFSAAARRVAVRDQWIGWNDEVRAGQLHRVVCNSRFLLLPWVHVRNLASRVLGLARRRLVRDWKQSYGYEPVLLESFVEQERFAGISYRAANWVELGETTGRGRQDRAHACAGSKKKVFVYPLGERWRERLGVAPAQASGDWAEAEFGSARFGDCRLTQRFVSIARDFYSRPQANIPKACNGERAKVKAVYRFLDNQEVTLAKLLKPHQEQTLKRMAEHKVVLAVQDSTSLNYTAHTLTAGLGPIGTKHSGALGLIVHDTVAVTPEGLALGVLDAQVWVRDWEDKQAGRPIEQKESVKWLRSYQLAAKLQGQLKKTRVVSVGDREADIYELFAMAGEHIEAGGPHLLVRASEDRCLAETQKKLWDRVQTQPLAGYREVVVPPRPGRKARKANLSVRFCEVVLSPPQGKSALGNIRLWAVHARERRAPSGVEAVEWMLLTTMEVNDFDQACEKLDWYVQRWMIEVFHRTLKTGCRIEDRLLRTVPRLENCLTIDMMVAVRIMHLTWLGRTHPNRPCTIYFEDNQWKALSCFLTRKRTPQKTTPSIREVVGWIAKLGGYLGRNSDRAPGTQVLWEGIQRADDIIETTKLFTNFDHGP